MKTLFFGLGIITGLAFARIPHLYDGGKHPILHALMHGAVGPEDPVGWAPKLRTWHNGVLLSSPEGEGHNGEEVRDA